MASPLPAERTAATGSSVSSSTSGEAMNNAVMEVQKKIVAALSRTIGAQWEWTVVNCEMQEEDGGPTEDRRGFYITPDGTGGFHKASLTFDTTAKDLFRALGLEMRRSKGQGRGGCDLVVDQSGRLRFNFSYDPPRRINGVFDEASMGRFDRYLQTYAAERAGA
jgi:hypothetical protein